ncbi:pentatricopeptide repeat-containing protein At5g18390, mitochondrial [Spinacia oleracea]|uniref:Pentatricopeptide repeat-containing protein At5g18390, mitochondrial n=1 Tax=Spinacia oleracea TaxID=3562 RepID=A0A9R0IU30_SPIOL|nr:pentatricopeptide repeat-containing protein At5g18390, mitochondrial [Spinacia oleracea]XP_021855361.2 pentatricopeptide repeat-containing protein At5g18390, mitochondrial [Spinacia oleracea]XP_056699496.1 pentatricopeptide repeat-containing protein At5g18390, mitochondrial [Spinacia oleracea]XP_056699497.1 pentatricopeptide repeat-containing protein At5g18390, mitochondrial [Spinacia oleracea]XP_056699498.1 pentatricopeptide repeat-containing protein At5g18390, mitochondrial [Spinacia olera
MISSTANSILRHCLLHSHPTSPSTPFSLLPLNSLFSLLSTFSSSNGRKHPSSTTTTTNDEYFAAIHHISNIVRRDIYLERTLNKLRLTVTNELVYRVLRSCSRDGIQSFRFFNWARSYSPSYSPTAIEHEELIKTLARTHHWETMWKALHQLCKESSLNFSTEVIEFIIREYGSKGFIDEAVRVFNSCPKVFKCEQTVGVYNSLLFALCEGKNFYGAYSLIRRMIKKGVNPNKETYSVLVNAWCKAGKLREAQEFLEEMSKKGFNPPVRGRDLLIDGLLNAGHVENAKSLVRKMAEEGFVPDIRTFNSLLEAIFKSGEVEFCIELFNDVCKLGLCPDIDTYKIMIPIVAKLYKLDEAFRLLHCSIEEGHKPFPSLYAPILKALCRAGQFDDAFCFFSDMKIKGHPPNRPVYTMLIRMCARGGRFVEAANYLVEMTEMNLPPLSKNFDVVTDGLKNSGKHDLAERIEQLEVSLRGA